MSVYIEFSEGDSGLMNLRFLKYKEDVLEEVGDENDIEYNATELFALVLFNLVANGKEGINDKVFKAMEYVNANILDSAKEPKESEESASDTERSN